MIISQGVFISMAVKYSKVLNSLAMQFIKSEDINENVDVQLNNIFNMIKEHFNKLEIELVLDWFHATTLKEQELKNKIKNNPFVYDNNSIKILLSKTNALHSKIIVLVVDKIDEVAYIDSEENIRVIFDLAQSFISSLTINRTNNEVIYDNYIKTLTQAMEIFKLI